MPEGCHGAGRKARLFRPAGAGDTPPSEAPGAFPPVPVRGNSVPGEGHAPPLAGTGEIHSARAAAAENFWSISAKDGADRGTRLVDHAPVQFPSILEKA